MNNALELLPEPVATSLPVPLPCPTSPSVPPLLEGTSTPDVQRRVEKFYQAIERIFESWVHRSESVHTRRAYRDDVMSFVRFLGLAWPEEALGHSGLHGRFSRWCKEVCRAKCMMWH